MASKTRKSVSFSAMVKFFMQQYEIPTRRDIERILSRIDRLETIVQSAASARRKSALGRSRPAAGRGSAEDSGAKALDKVLSAIHDAANGMTVKAIEEATGFDVKKIRNCIYRLGKLSKIKRASRGTYVAIP